MYYGYVINGCAILLTIMGPDDNIWIQPNLTAIFVFKGLGEANNETELDSGATALRTSFLKARTKYSLVNNSFCKLLPIAILTYGLHSILQYTYPA